MKLSLAWIFDHIAADYKKIDVTSLVNLFNQKTAEIEGVTKISIDLHDYALAVIDEIGVQEIKVCIPEWSVQAELSLRTDACAQGFYLVKRSSTGIQWATLADFQSAKPGLMPQLFIKKEQLSGGWKKEFEHTDYILHLDNKSVNHRPDLWGHRGVAREMAALLSVPLKPLDTFTYHHKVAFFELKADPSSKHPQGVAIETTACKRFSGITVSGANHPCALMMAARLARVDSRPINFIVDATNYVMLDLSQPLYAFDFTEIFNASAYCAPSNGQREIKASGWPGN